MNEVSLNGDSHIEAIPTIKQKALRINLNENIYGTFAEIGAGQETVRQFFRVGGTVRNRFRHGQWLERDGRSSL